MAGCDVSRKLLHWLSCFVHYEMLVGNYYPVHILYKCNQTKEVERSKNTKWKKTKYFLKHKGTIQRVVFSEKNWRKQGFSSIYRGARRFCLTEHRTVSSATRGDLCSSGSDWISSNKKNVLKNRLKICWQNSTRVKKWGFLQFFFSVKNKTL